MKTLYEVNKSLVSYKLSRVSPKIYVVEVKDDYERGMLFMRAQEHYETPMDEFRGKSFNIFEFMNTYRLKQQSTFLSCLYTQHWAGFNVPSTSLEKCYPLDATRDHFHGFITPYDLEMYDIIKNIRTCQPNGKFYIIGVDNLESKTMNHELAHALYFTNSEYKKEMMEALSVLPTPMRLKISEVLGEMGYTMEVFDDEAQAFLSTGIWRGMEKIKGIKKTAKLFNVIFKRYENQIRKV